MMHHHISIIHLIDAVDWTLIRPLLTQLLCLPVLILASQRSLCVSPLDSLVPHSEAQIDPPQTHITLSSFSPPPPLTGSANSNDDGEVTTSETWQDKLFSRKTLKLCVLFNVVMSIGNLIVMGPLPRFSSQSACDRFWAISYGIWTAFLLFIVRTCTSPQRALLIRSQASLQLLPPTSTVHYQHDTKTGSTHVKLQATISLTDLLRFPLAIGLSYAILATANAGYLALSPLVSVAFLITFSTLRTPRQRAMQWPVIMALGLEVSQKTVSIVQI